MYAFLMFLVITSQSGAAQAPKPKASAQWKFQEFTSEMDGKKTQSLSQDSFRTASGGSYKPKLDIICGGKEQTTMVVVRDTGPVGIMDDNWTAIRYKFEDNVVHETQWRWLSAPASALMSTKSGEFLGQMLTHKNLMFEFQSLRSGEQIAEFDLLDGSIALTFSDKTL